MNKRWSVELELKGAGGEPVDLQRTLVSHGLVELPPMRLEEDVPALELTLAANGRARTVEIRPGRRDHARVTVLGRAPSARTADELIARVRHVLALDEDLSEFYEHVADDPDLSWAAAGAGRMIRAPSVFEDVVKTVNLDTNSPQRESSFALPAWARLRSPFLAQPGRSVTFLAGDATERLKA